MNGNDVCGSSGALRQWHSNCGPAVARQACGIKSFLYYRHCPVKCLWRSRPPQRLASALPQGCVVEEGSPEC